MFFQDKRKSVSHFTTLTFSVNHALDIVEFLNRQKVPVTQTYQTSTEREYINVSQIGAYTKTHFHFLKAKLDSLFILSLYAILADIC